MFLLSMLLSCNMYIGQNIRSSSFVRAWLRSQTNSMFVSHTHAHKHTHTPPPRTSDFYDFKNPKMFLRNRYMSDTSHISHAHNADTSRVQVQESNPNFPDTRPLTTVSEKNRPRPPASRLRFSIESCQRR